MKRLLDGSDFGVDLRIDHELLGGVAVSEFVFRFGDEEPTGGGCWRIVSGVDSAEGGFTSDHSCRYVVGPVAESSNDEVVVFMALEKGVFGLLNFLW